MLCVIPWISGSKPVMCHPESGWSQAGLCPVPGFTVFYYTAFVGVRFMTFLLQIRPHALH